MVDQYSRALPVAIGHQYLSANHGKNPLLFSIERCGVGMKAIENLWVGQRDNAFYWGF
jgi:hypothetical protein